MKDIFAEFPPVTTTQWEAAIAKFLKGKSLDSLTWQIDETLRVRPLYRTEDTPASSPIQRHTQPKMWDIVERVQWKNIATDKPTTMQALQGGANELIIELADDAAEQWGAYFDGIWTDMIRLSWDLRHSATTWQQLATQLHSLQLATPARGHLYMAASIDDLADNYAALRQTFPLYSFVTIQETAYDAPTHAQRMAAMLTDVYRWAQLVAERGGSLADALATVQIEFTVGNDYFVEIAKLRAFQRLWLGVLEGMGETVAQFPRLTAATQSVFKADDSYYNLIVCTTQALSAVIGGIDALVVTPSTGWAQATEQSRRLARNVHHLLQYESHLDTVADPSAGSYYIENMTNQLTQESWQLFSMGFAVEG